MNVGLPLCLFLFLTFCFYLFVCMSLSLFDSLFFLFLFIYKLAILYIIIFTYHDYIILYRYKSNVITLPSVSTKCIYIFKNTWSCNTIRFTLLYLPKVFFIRFMPFRFFSHFLAIYQWLGQTLSKWSHFPLKRDYGCQHFSEIYIFSFTSLLLFFSVFFSLLFSSPRVADK